MSQYETIPLNFMLNEHDIRDYALTSPNQPESITFNPKPQDVYQKIYDTVNSVNAIQHGGTHYKQFKGMEPWDVIVGWGLGYLDGTALKYIARWKHKNGIQDLEKAIHFLQKTIEVEKAKHNV